MMKKIPVISLAPLTVESDADSADHRAAVSALAQEWDDAMRKFGFAIVVDTGIDFSESGPVAHLKAAARKFFHNDHSAKMKHNFGAYGNPLGGYTPQGVESVSKTTLETLKSGADLVENYVFRMYAPRGEDPFGERHPPELAAAGRVLSGEMTKLNRTLNTLSAISLGLDDTNYFNSFFDGEAGNSNSLRIAYYPQNEQVDWDGDSIRYGAHTDYQTYTLLIQDPKDNVDGFGGLEVLIDGEWIPIVPVKDGVVINSGDLTEVWTNGRWKSNFHRVVNPTSERGRQSERMSIPFFTGPREDAVITPLTACNSDGNGDYKPIKAIDHLMKKLGVSNNS